MPRTLVVHYAEIGTKGANRGHFERRLCAHVGLALEDLDVHVDVKRVQGRLTADLPDGVSDEDLLARVACVAGVREVAIGVAVPPDVEVFSREAIALLAKAPEGSFKIDARRGDKAIPLRTVEVNRAVGAACFAATGRPVDVHTPAAVIRIEIAGPVCYVIGPARQGPGGLPPGSTGTLLALLSGGIDSPVAAWKMMRRGARVIGVHFWNRSLAGNDVLEKIEDLARVLARAQGEMVLLVTPFEAIQRVIIATTAESLRMIVYRRAMRRIAERLAVVEGAVGLVTGDSLGQVASQTAQNLHVFHAGSSLPIHAPLIGDDKSDITNLARHIGTLEISSRPHEDCCSFLVGAHPRTEARLRDVAVAEAPIPWDDVIAEAVARTTRHVFHARGDAGRPVAASTAETSCRVESAAGPVSDADSSARDVNLS